MERLIQDFVEKMHIKNFADNTKKSYRNELKKYLRYCESKKLEYNSQTFQKYLSEIISIKKLSECSLKQSIGAAKFFLLHA